MRNLLLAAALLALVSVTAAAVAATGKVKVPARVIKEKQVLTPACGQQRAALIAEITWARSIHIYYIGAVAHNKQLAKTEGDVDWQRYWVAVYNQALALLAIDCQKPVMVSPVTVKASSVSAPAEIASIEQSLTAACSEPLAVSIANLEWDSEIHQSWLAEVTAKPSLARIAGNAAWQRYWISIFTQAQTLLTADCTPPLPATTPPQSPPTATVPAETVTAIAHWR